MSEPEQGWESGEVWQEKTEAALNMLSDRMDAATRKRFKIDLLKRCLRRIVQFETECHECRVYREKIRILLKNTDPLDVQSKAVRKEFAGQVREISGHLTRKHKLSLPWTGGTPIGIMFLMGSRSLGRVIQNDLVVAGLGIGLFGLTMYLFETYLRKHDRIL